MILCDDDLIEWDDDYPPQLGQEEDKAQSTYLLVRDLLLNLSFSLLLFSYTFNGYVSIF